MNAVRPYTFALIVVCVVAASTVFQLQQLLKSSCASSTTAVPSVNTHSESESRVHSAGLCTADPLGLSTHRTKSDIRLGVILRPHSFKLSKSLLKRTDQIVKQTVCYAHPFLTDPGECIQSIHVDYFVSTNHPFYAHERVHKLPSSRCSTDCHPSIEWLDRNKKYFAHMDAVIFEGVLQLPNQKQSGLSQLPLHHPSGPAPSPSYLSTNSSIYLLTLQPSLESQWTHTEMDGSRQFSSTAARWPSASHTNRTIATSHKGPAAKQALPVPSDSWVDHFMSILDALVFGFDVESADAFGYDDTPTHGEDEDTPSLKPFQSPSEPGPDRNTDRDEDTKIDMQIAYAPDMSGDQFQWLLRVVVMVAWLHMFWDQL